MTSPASREHVLGRLELAGTRLRSLTPGDAAEPADVTDDLALVEKTADDAELAGERLRLRALGRAFALTGPDADLLLAAALPEVLDGAERLIASLTGDRNRVRMTAGLALRLAGLDRTDPAARARLGPAGPLVRGGLVELVTPDRPFLSRGLRVPDRVLMHLLGDDASEPAIAALSVVPGAWTGGGERGLARAEAALSSGAFLGYVRQQPGGDGFALAREALSRWGATALVIQLPDPAPAGVVAAALREARLRGAGLVIGPVESMTVKDALPALLDCVWPVLIVGRSAWDPNWARRVPFVLDAEPPPGPALAAVLADKLRPVVQPGLDLADVTATLRIDPQRIDQVAAAAWLHAAGNGGTNGGTVERDDVRAGIRAQNAAGLERLARRIEPAVTWDDVVLPARERAALDALAARIRWRETVLTEWGMGDQGRGQGVAALFAGSSGTGKTLAAEALAGSLGLDLYTVDLSSVVDKYVGETEKNLDRIFGEAERVNGVLFFDEADALFGKRSEVKDAHDRYANVETAYLLQRLEAFDGIVVLATNLRANLDDAFTRRLDIILDFPFPDAAHRRLIWDRQLRPGLPRGDDIDLDFLAARFELAGGNIRNIALAAAYLAAQAERPVSMTDLLRGTHRELLNLGRLVRPAEFAPYEGVVS